MSAARVSILSSTGQPVVAESARIADVSALPPVWDLEASIEWLVDGMIPRASVNLISAESGTGKTWLAYAIAGAVAHGTSFIGRTVHQAPVLYLDGENPLYVVKRNLTDLGISATENFRIWGGWNDEPPPGPDDDRIIRLAEQSEPLLIWDSLVEFNDGDEQSSTEIRDFMKFFRRLAHAGATVLVLHHTGKSQGSQLYRGSSDIKASVDMAYVVKGTQYRGKLHRLNLDPFKSRIAPGQKFAMEFHERNGFTAIEVPKQAIGTDPPAIVRRIVLEKPKMNAVAIKKSAGPFGISKGHVDQILKNGEYDFQPGKGAEKLYWLKPTEAPVEAIPDFPNAGVREDRNSSDGS